MEKAIDNRSSRLSRLLTIYPLNCEVAFFSTIYFKSLVIQFGEITQTRERENQRYEIKTRQSCQKFEVS